MKRSSSKPMGTASPMLIDAEQRPLLHLHAASFSSAGTSPMSATRLRQSPGGAAPASRQSPASAPMLTGGGGSHTGFPVRSVGYVQQPFRTDAVCGCSPINYGTAVAMAASRSMPALSVERLGEPVLMQGPMGTAAAAAMAMSFATPLSGELDALSTPPSSMATPANWNVSTTEYPSLTARSPMPTPMTPTEHSSTNLILYNVGPDMTEAALQNMFEPFGEVVSSAVMRDIHTGASLGTAFVRYAYHADARRALETFSDRANPVCLHESKPLVVQWARKQHDGAPAGEARKKIMKLFVRNVPLDCTAEDLEELFGAYGSVRQVTLHKDTSPVQDEAMVRLIAFVIYTEEGAAERAAREVHNTKPFASCNGIPIMVKLAESSQRRRFMKNAEAVGPISLAAVSAGFPAARTSPMAPGMNSSPFDFASAAQPHQQHLQQPQQATAPQQVMHEANGFEVSSSSYSMPVFESTTMYPPPDPREGSMGSYHGTIQPLLVSVSGGGTPAAMTPLASSIMGGSTGRYHQLTPAHAVDKEGRVSPHSSAAGSVLAHSYRRPASLSFDANAAAANGAFSASSKFNYQNLSDGMAGGCSAGGCPNGSFLYCDSTTGDTNTTVITAAPDCELSHTLASCPCSEASGGYFPPNGSFTASPQLTRKGVEATPSPTATAAAFAVGSAPPPGPLRSGAAPSVALSSACGSLQQSTGLQRTPPANMTVTGSVAASRLVSAAFVPASGQAGAVPPPSARPPAASSMCTPDMGFTTPNGSSTVSMNAAAHNRESPTRRTDASESWRRAVRTHVHNTKLQNERCNASSSLPSTPSVSISSTAPTPATPPPVAAPKGIVLSLSCIQPSATGSTPPRSPIYSPTQSNAPADPKSAGPGALPPGRMRYYHNPYSSESTKLFC
ncbi:hypothetical protein LSCM1_04431 [Leishmania martiniquensis]|uniref:RRM domain-containing protein n=1 Tax=Leishmania martiniquensis TaxID=1580590 RepID=A0A836HA02_9TRYP|nr:hypothetical protein LSCM1_04431 [Leishmania martiniquensis]